MSGQYRKPINKTALAFFQVLVAEKEALNGLKYLSREYRRLDVSRAFNGNGVTINTHIFASPFATSPIILKIEPNFLNQELNFREGSPVVKLLLDGRRHHDLKAKHPTQAIRAALRVIEGHLANHAF